MSRRPTAAVASTATALFLALVGLSSGGEVTVKSPAFTMYGEQPKTVFPRLSPAFQTQVFGEARQRPPIAILLHSGGFILPEPPTGMEQARRASMAAGLEPIDIDYTLGDPMQAWRDVRDIVRRYKAAGRRIVAYGDSAGGNLAALLAQHGVAEAAVVNSPPSSLVNWPYREGMDDPPQVMGMDLWDFEKMSLKERQFLSPKLHRTHNPIMVMATPEDAVVPYSMNTTWAKADPNVKLWQINGEHMGGAGAVYDRHLANAMRFLNGRLGRHNPSPLSHAPHAGGPVHPPGVPTQRCSSTSCTWAPFGNAEAPLDALAPREEQHLS